MWALTRVIFPIWPRRPARC